MILNAMAVVVALTLFGNVLAAIVALPVPGSALGLACLIGCFVVMGAPDQGSSTLFDTMAPHLSFFFVPAAAGLIAHSEIMIQSWILFAAAIVISTSIVIAITGVLAQALLNLAGQRTPT